MYMIEQLYNKLVSSSPAPPPPQDAYAMTWQPGQGGDGPLTPYETMRYTHPGISIGFQNEALDHNGAANFFGDGVNPLPLYPVPPPAHVGQPVNDAATALQQAGKANPSAQSRALVQGYLDYTSEALNLLYGTAAGKIAIDGIIATNQTVMIVVQMVYMGNAYTSAHGKLCPVATQLITEFDNRQMDKVTVLDWVKTASGNQDPLGACTWLATQVNTLPLYSLFVTNPEYAHNGFLQQFLQYNGNPVSGQVIHDWLTDADGGAFQNFLQTDGTTQDEVKLVDYFRSALIMQLYNVSGVGAGAGSTIMFKVAYDPADPQDIATQRPPAVGLGHELVHAYHSARGGQPGQELYHFSTVLTERLCVGLVPFDTVSPRENEIRAQWGTVAARATVPFDQMNPVPPRPVYELAANPGEVLTSRRTARTP